MRDPNVSHNDLSALFINCTIKKDPTQSHTRRLINRAAGVMRAEGVEVEILHALDHQIAFGMEKDLTEHGWDRDDWPAIQQKILAADILVLGSPIWLGVKSSVATLVVERMYAYSDDRNEKGQYVYYGKTAGCVITGNEDGIKHCSMDILYAMQHIGYMIRRRPTVAGSAKRDPVRATGIPHGTASPSTRRLGTATTSPTETRRSWPGT